MEPVPVDKIAFTGECPFEPCSQVFIELNAPFSVSRYYQVEVISHDLECDYPAIFEQAADRCQNPHSGVKVFTDAEYVLHPCSVRADVPIWPVVNELILTDSLLL